MANGRVQQAATLRGGKEIEEGAVLAILAAEEAAHAAVVRRINCLNILFAGKVTDANRSDIQAVLELFTKQILGEAGSVGCCRSRGIDNLRSGRDVGND